MRARRTDYERLASRYDEDRSRWSFPVDDVLASASSTGWRVLDLGCGTGRWIESQRKGFVDIAFVGVDPSASMLGEAAAKGIAPLVRGRAEALPFGDASLDYVVSSYAFHHFTDKERALDEVARVLVDRGAFRINNIEPTAADGWWIYEFFPETAAADAVRFWPPARVRAALETRGFTVEVELESGVGTVAATEALADAERRVVSQLAILDDDAYDRGLARLRAVAGRPGATVTTTPSRLRLTAVRSG